MEWTRFHYSYIIHTLDQLHYLQWLSLMFHYEKEESDCPLVVDSPFDLVLWLYLKLCLLDVTTTYLW